jgi:ABC-2 type transport system ATP-binding protein
VNVSPSAPSAAVEVCGLVRNFGTVRAVDGLDLLVQRATVLGLLGPNGAGKTTTVEVCEGSAQPLNVGWLLDVLGLTGVARVPYKRLSGGQQQRLALACALVGRPEVVFLDEPTAGMDPQARRLVWDIITSLRADGVSVLFTTHLMEEAEALADQVVIIDHGRVVAKGSPADLTSSGTQRQLRFRARPGLDLGPLGTALPEDCRTTEPRPGEYLVDGLIDPHVMATVTAWCAQQGVFAEDLRVSRRSLEDVFLELTGRELRS